MSADEFIASLQNLKALRIKTTCSNIMGKKTGTRSKALHEGGRVGHAKKQGLERRFLSLLQGRFVRTLTRLKAVRSL